MGNTLTLKRAYDWFGWQRSVVLLMVGPPFAGKTTLLYQMHLGETTHTVPTIGANIEELKRGNLRMQVWDVGGSTPWSYYARDANAVVLVLDASDPAAATQVQTALRELTGTLRHRQAPLLIFANKQDHPKAQGVGLFEHEVRVSALTDSRCHVTECCALTGEGVEAGLLWLRQAV